MAQLTIQEDLWRRFAAVAQQRRRKPEILAEGLLRDYLQRAADEELLARSEQAARRTSFPIGQTEELIRLHRRKGKRA